MIKIPNDEQLVFDTVAEHLLKQGERSIYEDSDGNEACAYRGDGGLKCAAGCLIPDEQYNLKMEGLSWTGLVLNERVSKHCESLITNLQLIHDNDTPDTWLSGLHKLAKNKNLDTSKLPPL